MFAYDLGAGSEWLSPSILCPQIPSICPSLTKFIRVKVNERVVLVTP
jgi:hypothetical protein